MAEEAINMPTINPDSCPYCKSANIVKHVKIDQISVASKIGLSYKTGFLLQGVEPLFVDLCDNCGTFLRIFVDTPRRQWMHK